MSLKQVAHQRQDHVPKCHHSGKGFAPMLCFGPRSFQVFIRRDRSRYRKQYRTKIKKNPHLHHRRLEAQGSCEDGHVSVVGKTIEDASFGG